MRAVMAPPPPRAPSARVAALSHPALAAGRWFITNKDYPGNGTFCPFGSPPSRAEPSKCELGAH